MCDFNATLWDLPVANVICRQMGFDHGSVHVEHGQSTFAKFQDSITEKVITKGVQCKGKSTLSINNLKFIVKVKLGALDLYNGFYFNISNFKMIKKIKKY